MIKVKEVVCIRCISRELKDIVLAQVNDPGIRSLPKCGDGSPIGFAVAEGEYVRAPPPGEEQRGRSRGGKRAPSDYNIFVGQCIKGKSGDFPDRMRSCAVEWREKKGR